LFLLDLSNNTKRLIRQHNENTTLVANHVRLLTPYCPKRSVRERISQPRDFPRQIGKDCNFLTQQQGPQRRPVEADVRKLLALEMERTSSWLKQRLGLWNLCEVEGRFWMSLKETSSVFFRVALWCWDRSHPADLRSVSSASASSSWP